MAVEPGQPGAIRGVYDISAITRPIAQCPEPQRIFVWKRYAYGWVTLGFFLLSLAGHWLFGWFAYVSNQIDHDQPVRINEYVIEMSRAKLDAILRTVEPEEGERIIAMLDREYGR